MLGGIDIMMLSESSMLVENDVRAFNVARNEFVYTENQNLPWGKCEINGSGNIRRPMQK